MDDPATEGNIIVIVPTTLPVEEEAVLKEEAGASASAEDGKKKVKEVQWQWAPCLSIPKADVLKFSLKPYKWIRFITGIVLGAEGVLCDSDDDNAPEIDYDSPLVPGDSSLYFHATPAERARMFPLDPDLARPHSATGPVGSTRCEDFRESVVDRDERCVASGAHELSCDAAHLIRHRKGDKYIETFTNGRSRDPNCSDHIDDIDDPHNGLLVNLFIHRVLSRSGAAFLLTPNFAMSSSDVDGTLQADDQRWTVHDFEGVLHPEMQSPTRPNNIPHGRALHVPANQTSWPPRILFDAVYASAVLKEYAHEDYFTLVSMPWRDRFYPGGVRNTRADGGMMEMIHERALDNIRKPENEQKRNERLAKRRNPIGGIEGIDPPRFTFMISVRPPTRAQRERWVTEQRELEAAEHRSWTVKWRLGWMARREIAFLLPQWP